MKLFEYAGKELFSRHGITVPVSRVVTSTAEAIDAGTEIGYPVVCKVQVLSGGRGKAGGIKFCDDEQQLQQAVEELLGSKIKGLPVETLLIEQKLDIDEEYYLGLIVDSTRRQPLLIFSPHGGVDIEQVDDEYIARVPIDVCFGLSPYMVRQALLRFDITGKKAAAIAGIAERLYKMAVSYDLEMVEINPLVMSGTTAIAADARCTVDDYALYRHRDLPKTVEGTPLELEIRQAGLAFVELDGDIAVMANGAGITMAVIDMLSDYGGKAANFLDAGGGAGIEPTAVGIRALLRTRPRAILICIFGGITRCDDVAQAILKVMDEQDVDIPVVVRLTGTNRAEAVELLQPRGIVPCTELEDAIKNVVAAASGGV